MDSSTSTRIYRLIFAVPLAYFPAVKAAVHESGAGNFPGYSSVSFQTQGKSMFLPDGATGPKETEEMKVEIFCIGRLQAIAAVEAMKK